MTRTRVCAAIVALLLCTTSGCAPCREYAASVAASAEALQPFTLRGVDAALEAGEITPDTATALRGEASDLVRSARIAAGLPR